MNHLKHIKDIAETALIVSVGSIATIFLLPLWICKKRVLTKKIKAMKKYDEINGLITRVSEKGHLPVVFIDGGSALACDSERTFIKYVIWRLVDENHLKFPWCKIDLCIRSRSIVEIYKELAQYKLNVFKVEVMRMDRCAKIIQRSWRKWNHQKRKQAALTIEAHVIEWLYRPEGIYYKRAKARWGGGGSNNICVI